MEGNVTLIEVGIELTMEKMLSIDREMNMKIDATVDKIKRRQLTIGSWIQIGDPAVAKLISSCGFDWVALDLEHGKYGGKDLPVLFDTIRANDCLPLARLADNCPILTKRALDAGAGGVIVPMVNSREEAERAVAAAKYPPKGIRGIGFSNASNFGKDFAGYFECWNDRAIVIIQIEHIDAVNDLEAMLAVEGVDGFIVGPYDLTGSMGITGQFDHTEFKAAMNRITDLGESSGKLMGIHIVQPDVKVTVSRIKAGYNFIAYSIDAVVLWRSFVEAVAKIRDSVLCSDILKNGE